jgi:hypothetical protein
MNAKALNRLNRRHESADEDFKEAREKLALEAAKSSSHQLSNLLSRFAELEGRVFVLAQVIRAIESGRSAQLGDLLMSLVTDGAGDSWSGRTNDVARSRFDGIRTAVREVHETLAAFPDEPAEATDATMVEQAEREAGWDRNA